MKNPFQLFLTILLPFLLSTVLLLFVQSSFLTQNFESFALQMVYNQQKNDLQNSSRNVSVMAQSARSVATTAFFDETIKELLYSDVNAVDYIKYQDKLASYKNIYPFLQSIYIYNGSHIHALPSQKFVYDRSTFEDMGIFPILDDIQHNRSHSIVLRQIPNMMYGISSNAEKDVYVYSYLFFDSQVQSGKVSEAIILNISEESIKQTISTSDHINDNRIFIIDRDGRLMSSDGKHPLLSALKENDYIQRIQSSKEASGNLRMNVDGVDSFITYADTDAFGWKVISITPYLSIVKDVEQMKQKTYLLVICFIVGSILLSFYLSRRLYKPINVVIQNYIELESEKRNELYNRKQNFLRSMVLSNEMMPVDILQKRFHAYHIELELADSFLLLLIKIDHFADFCSAFSLKDRGLLKFGMINIISELLSSTYKHECIEIEEDQILIWMNYYGSEFPSKDDSLVSLVKDIQGNIEKFLNVSISITFSEPFRMLNSINFHYLKTLDLSNYRLITGHQALISYDRIDIQTGEFKYPQDQDKELADALIQGQFAEAKQVLSSVIHAASRYSYTVLNSVLIRLLLSIRHAIEITEANHAIKVNFNFNTYLTALQKMETIEQIQSDFHELFDHLAIELEAKKDNKYIKLIEDVNQIVHAEFANPALSLEEIAEKVNLSSPYLGKLYKKHRLISVTDYINHVRLSYASKLIAESEETINDIMEKSGFISRSHFFTLFKKAFGVTPNQYRSNANARN
ncbi:AraC family transcriptional regulator [Paenibacillus roseipurpureus]|uniref:AraC family transcriptional regulator n=1 Tax=Paenibacillus roseopurpureus TaxID=2918901 RepID=A0AA96LN37_9BACL|nr:AraC family transcriptional regulator [Paenibacillus sp. MBLB1832]WNR42763.1 AraC family transcriptional regulator [Paenibacillus sp. MBLB1832]